MNDFQCTVRLVNLPTSIKGFVREDEDGYFTVIINARLDYYTQKKCFLHEMKHIANEDFKKYIADDIERETHMDFY